MTRRYLIETHSEHLMLRTQLKVAEQAKHKESLPPALPAEVELEVQEFKGRDFTLMFITRDVTRGESALERIKFDRFGRIMAPSKQFRDFFGRDFKDATALSLAIAEAMNQGGEK